MARGMRVPFTACCEARPAQDVVYVSSSTKDAQNLPKGFQALISLHLSLYQTLLAVAVVE